METATFRELLSPGGQVALAAAAALEPTEAGFLASFEKLRKRFPADLAKAALETALLRIRARSKFASSAGMYFTREALEQASSEVIARYRAGRFAPFGEVADLCAGIGGDCLALAAAGLTVHAVERDQLHAAMTAENAAAVGLPGQIRVYEADALSVALPGVRAAFADPARRAGGRRYLDPEDYTPSLSALRGRFPADFPLGVKIAPGVAWADLAGLDAEAEFISVNGELKECVLWFGPLRTAARRATVLPAGATLFVDDSTPGPPISPVDEFVFDPDASVVRAGLSGQLAIELGLAPIDYTVAMFTGPALVHSPFMTPYSVELAARFNLKALRDHLHEKQVGRVTVVKRGSQLDADEVTKKLNLDGGEHRVVILTRANGGPVMIVGQRLAESPGTEVPGD